jgi:hypothetical protein
MYLSYFDQLRGQFGCMAMTMPESPDVRAGASIVDSPRPTWSDCFTLETIILRMLSDPRLRRTAWSLRERYRVAMGQDRYERYLATSPPDPETATMEALRADLEQLLDELHAHYLNTLASEGLYGLMNRRTAAMVGLIVAAGLVLLTWSRTNRSVEVFVHYALVLSMGAVGGYISLQQRLAGSKTGDPVIAQLVLGRASLNISLAPITGAIMALNFDLLIQSELIGGRLFPEPMRPGQFAPMRPDQFESTRNGPLLLVWSFLAGFAERFVPDALQRLVRRQMDDAATTAASARGASSGIELDRGSLREAIEQGVGTQIQRALQGPELINYKGFLCARFTDKDGQRLPSKGKVSTAQPGTTCRLEVWLQATEPEGVAEPITIRDGRDADAADFTLELDSDELDLESKHVRITARQGERTDPVAVEFVAPKVASQVTPQAGLSIAAPTKPNHCSVWIMAFQANRTIQTIRAELEVGSISWGHGGT